jgi:hypothetical protein
MQPAPYSSPRENRRIRTLMSFDAPLLDVHQAIVRFGEPREAPPTVDS